jgi:carboxyl-terminal processing protease
MEENPIEHIKVSANAAPKKLNVWLPLALSAATVLGIMVGMKLKGEPYIKVVRPAATNGIDESQANPFGNGRIEEILRYIDAKHVERLGDEQLTETAIRKLLEDLDPHSEYIPAHEAQAVNEDLEGEYDGIGIRYVIADDSLVVETPMAGTPAERAGLLAGDKILRIGDSIMTGKRLTDEYARKCLSGKSGTKVKLQIWREDDEGRISQSEHILVRERITDRSIEIAMMLDEKTGYIKINRFSQQTAQEFIEKVGKLTDKNGLKDLVIDVRGNPGGYLEQAIDILSQIFKEKDRQLVYTDGRTVHRTEYKSTGRSILDIEKVALLIDEGSASASEVLAGALQDWDRGIIIGRRSFGKGLVQEHYPLKDGAALRLTVAKYYIPSGRLIQKPYKNKTRHEYEREEVERLQSAEMYISDSMKINDQKPYRTKAGRTVYGGGGIMPDYFVPKDPVFQNEYYLKISPYLTEMSYKIVSGNRKWLKKMKNMDEYLKAYQITDVHFKDFIKLTERRGIKPQTAYFTNVKGEIKRQLKSRVGRILYGDIAYYSVLNNNDNCIEKARSVLKLNDPLNLQQIGKKK